MGIVLSALAGAAGGYDAAMDQNRKESEAAATDVRRSGLEEQRQRALLLFKSQQEDTQRSAMTDRVNQAAGSIADSAVAQKRGIVQNAIADPEAWTADQQAAVDQSLALDRNAAVRDPRTLREAAIRTGDIDPKTAATLADSERRLDSADNKSAAIEAASERKDIRERERMERKDATDNERMDRRDKIEAEKIRIAEQRLELMEKRQANGGSDKLGREERLRYTTLYNDSGRQMIEAQKSLRKLQSDFMYQNAPKGSTQAQELEDLKSTITDYKQQRELYGSLLAGGAGEGATSSPSAIMPNAKPAAAGTPEAAMRKQVQGVDVDLAKEITDTERLIASPSTNPKDRATAQQYLSTLKAQQGTGQQASAKPAARPPLSSFQR